MAEKRFGELPGAGTVEDGDLIPARQSKSGGGYETRGMRADAIRAYVRDGLTAADAGARPAGNIPWSDVIDKPADYPPSAHTHAWGEITDKPAVIAAGATQAAARSAIGAGTSDLALGNTSSTAKPGDWLPAWGDVSGKPAFGSAATASAGDFATAGQGAKADSAVQPGSLGALAAKDKVAIGDITATGTPGSGTYLRGDGAWVPVSGGGGGDMMAATYDPGGINGDAFDMGNMAESGSAKILTAAERSKLAGIETGAQVNAVLSVNAKTGAVTLSAADVGARPDDWVPAWGDVTGKPSTFPPSAHSHAIGDVTGLQGALDGKASAGHTHAWGEITDKPAVIASGATKADARAAVDAIALADVEAYTAPVQQVTQAQYDALDPPDPGTVYVVVD